MSADTDCARSRVLEATNTFAERSREAIPPLQTTTNRFPGSNTSIVVNRLRSFSPRSRRAANAVDGPEDSDFTQRIGGDRKSLSASRRMLGEGTHLPFGTDDKLGCGHFVCESWIPNWSANGCQYSHSMTPGHIPNVC